MLTPMNRAGGLPTSFELRMADKGRLVARHVPFPLAHSRAGSLQFRRMTCTTEKGSRSWREAKFPLSIAMVPKGGRTSLRPYFSEALIAPNSSLLSSFFLFRDQLPTHFLKVSRFALFSASALPR